MPKEASLCWSMEKIQHYPCACILQKTYSKNWVVWGGEGLDRKTEGEVGLEVLTSKTISKWVKGQCRNLCGYLLCQLLYLLICFFPHIHFSLAHLFLSAKTFESVCLSNLICFYQQSFFWILLCLKEKYSFHLFLLSFSY